ncbi:MAG: hypothetical protein V3T08_09850 [Gemmatimonadota bacterium]
MRPCVEPGCSEPAGTPWTRFWCPGHDVGRRHRVTSSLERLVAQRSGRTIRELFDLANEEFVKVVAAQWVCTCGYFNVGSACTKCGDPR